MADGPIVHPAATHVAAPVPGMIQRVLRPVIDEPVELGEVRDTSHDILEPRSISLLVGNNDNLGSLAGQIFDAMGEL